MKGYILLWKDKNSNEVHFDSYAKCENGTLADTLKKQKISLTKLLGGKDIVRTYRTWTHHGCGGYVTHWFFDYKNYDKVVANIKSYDYKVLLNVREYYDSELKCNVIKSLETGEELLRY